MDKSNQHHNESERTFSVDSRWHAAVLCLSLCFFMSSCATQNIGKLQSSSEITKIFENHQILPDYFYYYSGLQGVPDAIIGIHTNYSLRLDQWQQVDLTSLTLNTWISRMQAVQLMRPQGAWILDSEGNRVGIWFSGLQQTAVRLQQDNRVVIVPPKPPKLQGIR